jgi:hypothetical protein
VYKSFGDEPGQVFSGTTTASLCVRSGKITGSVQGVTISNGLGQSCEIDLTFNP